MAKDSRIGITGGGGRTSGGITGKGGANVNPKYNESVPPLGQGAPGVKVSPNVTVKAPGQKGQLMTQNDIYHNPKYKK